MAEALDELLARCGKGDDQAVRTLVHRFSTRMLDLAAALVGDRHLAEDAVQEAFLAALRRLGDLREPAAFPAWLRQIVRTHCIRILRRRKERPVPEVRDRPAAVASPAQRAERAETRAVVRAALASLPPAGRAAAELFYLEERSYADIAAHLDLPLGTVKRRLHDARERLRDLLLGHVAPRPAPDRRPPARHLPL